MTVHKFDANTIIIASMSVMITLVKTSKGITLKVTDKFISSESNIKLNQRQKDQLRQALCRIQLDNARAVTFLRESGL